MIPSHSGTAKHRFWVRSLSHEGQLYFTPPVPPDRWFSWYIVTRSL